jgi:site-specific recombinase XerD
VNWQRKEKHKQFRLVQDAEGAGGRRGAPFSVAGLEKLISRLGVAAEMPFPIHPHMLRHATGYALANKGTDTRTLQGYLGHRSIQSTVRYAELAPNRFKNIWRRAKALTRCCGRRPR